MLTHEALVCLIKHVFSNNVVLWLAATAVCSLQYSQKEDKYEEEIKILTDKLKEVGL